VETAVRQVIKTTGRDEIKTFCSEVCIKRWHSRNINMVRINNIEINTEHWWNVPQVSRGVTSGPLAMGRGLTSTAMAWPTSHSSITPNRERVSITNRRVVENCEVWESDEIRNCTTWPERGFIRIKVRTCGAYCQHHFSCAKESYFLLLSFNYAWRQMTSSRGLSAGCNQSLWGLWWTKCQWNKFSSKYFCFSSVSILSDLHHAYILFV
jgi:hypothetical protein